MHLRLLTRAAVLGLIVAACSESAPTAAPDAPRKTAPPSKEGGAPPADEPDAGEVTLDPEVDAGPTPIEENRDRGMSAGCGKAGAGKGLQTRTMQVNGKTRSYLRFIPAGYDPATPLSLVVALHGSGGTSTGTRTTFDLEGAAAGKAIFIYPQALAEAGGDARWKPEMDSEDYDFFDALVAESEGTHCVDRDREFVTGFSLGARFTSMLGCYRGDTIRAIAPVAPGMNAQNLPLAKGPCKGEVAIWEGLGDDDADHREGALLVRDFYAARNGCSPTRTATTPAGCESYDGCRSTVPSTWCTYPGGHKWPAIGPAGVWGFFAQFK